MTGPVPARFEGRKRNYAGSPTLVVFAVWDSFEQSWREGEGLFTNADAAIKAAGRLNREYEGKDDA